MKLATRIALALSVLALAAPALACEGHEKMKTTEKQQQAKPAVATAAEKAPAAKPQAEQPAAKPAASPN